MFLTPTLAMAGTSQDTPLSFTEQKTISNEYIAALFGKDAIAEGSQPIQLAMLSDAELKKTEGAWVWKPFVGRIGIGFAGGFGASVLGQRGTTGRVNWGLAVQHGMLGAGLGGASRWLTNRGWF
jgi:hypothetical protein